MKFAIYQMQVIAGNPDANREKVKGWIEKISMDEASRPLTVVLPEMWTTGYQLESLTELAEENGKETSAFLSELAKRCGVHIVGGSIATKKEGGIFNTAIVFNANGDCVHTYDKIHLVPMLDEPMYLEGGNEAATVFELDGIKMGLIICYDLRFPELARGLALAGAEVLFIPAEWPKARSKHWAILQQARAIENQFYVLSANSVGSHNGTEYAGRSMVVDPWGDVIEEAGTEQETLYCDVHLGKAKQVRKDVPVFSSRRPDLYR